MDKVAFITHQSMHLLAQDEMTGIMQVVTQHGPVAALLIFAMGVGFWWLKYVSAPKAKADLENQKKITERQIAFIDKVEKLVESQDKSLQYLTVSNKQAQERNESLQARVEDMVSGLLIVNELLELGDFNEANRRAYALRVRHQLVK